MIPYTCPPKQSTAQVLPGKEHLQQQAQQLQEMLKTLELTPAAQKILESPETELQQQLQRRLRRLAIVQKNLATAAEILRSLSA